MSDDKPQYIYENGLILQPFIKIKLSDIGLNHYKEWNRFWDLNFDENGYSIFAKEYFDKVFQGMKINEITEHEIIHFNK